MKVLILFFSIFFLAGCSSLSRIDTYEFSENDKVSNCSQDSNQATFIEEKDFRIKINTTGTIEQIKFLVGPPLLPFLPLFLFLEKPEVNVLSFSICPFWGDISLKWEATQLKFAKHGKPVSLSPALIGKYKSLFKFDNYGRPVSSLSPALIGKYRSPWYSEDRLKRCSEKGRVLYFYLPVGSIGKSEGIAEKAVINLQLHTNRIPKVINIKLYRNNQLVYCPFFIPRNYALISPLTVSEKVKVSQKKH